MKVNIIYFGIIAEQLGTSSEEMFIEHPKMTTDLRAFFEEKYPLLSKLSFKIAVDHELRNHFHPNEKPTEISLLPPFAGG